MQYKLINDEQILDEGFRARLIKEIIGAENIERKNRELRKYEVYRDRTKKWVIKALLKEFSPETVMLMENRAANISIARKIVNKLSRAYMGGVIRELDDKQETETINQYASYLKADHAFKQIDRYEHLFKNTLLGILPELDTDATIGPMKPVYNLKLKPYPPYAYDVIEDYADNTKPRCVILTDFIERAQTTTAVNQDMRGDLKEQIIADSPEDAGQDCRTFIFWTKTYHFTCDKNGVIMPNLSPEGLLNPIQKLPFVNFSVDQDCSYWAEGGDDLIDGAVLVNVLLTDLFTISNHQGWGQPVVTGKNLPASFKLGPHRAILLEHEADDPTPTFQFVSANPPLDQWMRMIEMYVALILSTNNLSPRNISGKLDATNIASGISKLIDESESTEDVEEAQEEFRDKEPIVWGIFKAWYDLYLATDQLVDQLKEIGPINSTDVKLIFRDPKPVVTEDQKLANIKLRKELGISTMLDLIKLDNPHLSEEEAQAKLNELGAEKLSNVNAALQNALPQMADDLEENEDEPVELT